MCYMSCYIVLPLLHVVLHCATSPLPVVLHCATSPPLSTVSDPYASFHEAWRENDFLGRYLVSLRCSYHRCVDMYTSFPLFRSFFFSPSLTFFPPLPLSFSLSISACLFVLFQLLIEATCCFNCSLQQYLVSTAKWSYCFAAE